MEEPQEMELDWAVPSDAGVTSRRNRYLSVLLLLTGVVMFAGGFAVRSAMSLHPKVTASSSASSIIARTSSNLSTPDSGSSDATIVVDIHGDVHHPGVYHLSENARVQDAVSAAGGFVHAKDSAFVNMAASVDDGQEIVIPNVLQLQNQNKGQPSQGSVSSNKTFNQQSDTTGNSVATTSVRALINLNTADTSSLETLPGIGPGRAQAIVDYRRQHGPFRRLQDLEQVRGIGPQIFSRVKPYLIISNK